jgi:hypothetical protein
MRGEKRSKKEFSILILNSDFWILNSSKGFECYPEWPKACTG